MELNSTKICMCCVFYRFILQLFFIINCELEVQSLDLKKMKNTIKLDSSLQNKLKIVLSLTKIEISFIVLIYATQINVDAENTESFVPLLYL